MYPKLRAVLAIVSLTFALIPASLPASNANVIYPLAPTFVDVASGSNHVCALTSTNEVYCWGANSAYQSFPSDSQTILNPSPVIDLKNVLSIFAGGRHSCAILSDGFVKCWGENRSGQIGDGYQDSGPRLFPSYVHNLRNPVSLALGDSHTCALLADGKIRCWGSNTFGQLGDGSNVSSDIWVEVKSNIKFKAIDAGAFHTCALDEIGDVYCWGRNDSGQLGSGTTRNSNTPTVVLNLEGIRSISANFETSCAINTRGATWCWGNGTNSQLGNFDSQSKSIPVAVVDTAFLRSVGNYTPVTNVKQISTADSFSCLISGVDSVACWGKRYTTTAPNFVGQNQTSGTILSTSKISLGKDHACALRRDASIYCWGLDAFGEFGIGSAGTLFTTSPVPAGYWPAPPLEPKVDVVNDVAVVTWTRNVNDYDPTIAANLTVSVSISVNNGEFTCVASTSPNCQFGPLKSNTKYDLVINTSNTKKTTLRNLSFTTQRVFSLQEKRIEDARLKAEAEEKAKAAEAERKLEQERLAKEAAAKAEAQAKADEEAKRQAEIKAQQDNLIAICKSTNAKGQDLVDKITKTAALYKWSDYEAPFNRLLKAAPASLDCAALKYDLTDLANIDWSITQATSMHDFLSNQAEVRLKSGGLTFKISCTRDGKTSVFTRKTQTCPKGFVVFQRPNP